MVTGAGGSIGSEICRQVLKFRPKALVLVERAENSLFLVEQEFRALRTEAHVIPCIADITDRGAHGPDASRSIARRSCSTPPRTSTCR